MNRTNEEKLAILRKHQEICAALRRAYPKFSHHASFTKRVLPYIETELPGYTVRLKNERNFVGVNVWGNGLEWDSALSLSWCTFEGNVPKKTWQEQWLYDVDRQDPSDALERAKQESKLGAEFAKIEAKILELREKAASMIEALPIPASAVTRKDSVFWARASYRLQSEYPATFGDIKGVES